MLEKVEHYERELSAISSHKVRVQFEDDAHDFMHKHLVQAGLLDRSASNISQHDNYDLINADYEYYFQRNGSS